MGYPLRALPDGEGGQAAMKLSCLLLGCRWGEPVRFTSWGERLVQHKCQRCGALSTTVDRGRP